MERFSIRVRWKTCTLQFHGIHSIVFFGVALHFRELKSMDVHYLQNTLCQKIWNLHYPINFGQIYFESKT
eukprot:UN02072